MAVLVHGSSETVGSGVESRCRLSSWGG